MANTKSWGALLRQRIGKVLPYTERLVGFMPLIVPAALAAFGIVAMSLLLLDSFKSELVWPLGLLAAIIASVVVIRFVPSDRPGSRKERIVCDVLIVVGVLAWMGFNGFYTSQHVLTTRDPATYAVAAQWLTKQDSIKIDFPEVFQGVKGITTDSGGFRQSGDDIFAQGQHMLPALLGLGARIFDTYYLNMNVLFGGAALLALYAFGRLLARPRWALLATAAFACTLPLIYFSRDTYTEPLTAAFIFGSLALLWHAQQTRRWPLWLMAGLVAGAASLVRVDVYVVYVGLAAFLAVFIALSRRKERKQSLLHSALFAGGLAAMSVLAWIDITQLSPLYYDHIGDKYITQIIALMGVAVLGVVAAMFVWKNPVTLKRLDRATRPWRSQAVLAIIFLGVLFLASRPFWYTAYTTSQNSLVALLQERAGDPVAPRLYAEFTVNWVYWYLGPFLATLGIVGFAVVAAKSSVNRRLFLLPSVLVVACTALLYLVLPRISPDHIWATRRFLPVIFPAIAIYSAVIMDWFYEKHLKDVKLRSVFFVVIAGALIIGPLLTSRPFLTTRDIEVLAVIESTCDRLPDNAAVLWVGTGQVTAPQPTRAFCGVPSAGYREKSQEKPRKPTKDALAQFAVRAKDHGFTPIVALYSSDVHLLNRKVNDLFMVDRFGYKEMEQTLIRPPQRSVQRYIAPLLGVVQTDGHIKSYSLQH